MKGVFVPDKWLNATPNNFPGFPLLPEGAKRIGFEGKEAPKEIKGLYKGKRLPEKYMIKGASNPVQYSYNNS